MPTRFRIPLILFRSTLTALLMAGMGVAPAFAAQARSAPAAPAAPPPATDQELQATQEQLIKLLRLSPTLTTVVEHDPTLLSNQEYVNRNNPQLAQFLGSHPEVARNPEFYLFTHLNTEGGRDEALERAVWPELNQGWHPPTPGERIMDNVIPFLVFLGILLGLLWLTRQLLENRRWGRIFKLQTDVHSKLIERFGSNQELMTYIGTDGRSADLGRLGTGTAHAQCRSPRTHAIANRRGAHASRGRPARDQEQSWRRHDFAHAADGSCCAHAWNRVYHLRRNHVVAGCKAGPDAGAAISR